MSMILPSQAYELKLAPHPAPFSILNFTGLDQVSQLYRYEIEFTSPVAGIPMDQVLGRPAKFIADPIDPNMDYLRKMFGANAAQFSKKPPAYTVHGIITKFDEFETSADETRYRVVLEPTLVDLDRGVTSRLFQKQSVEEIVTDTLRHFGYRAGVDFVFQLRGEYKRREYVTQYHETTFAFIRRICAEEGIWFRWEQKKDRAVVVFGDDLDAYARKQRAVPHRRDSGLESVGADAIKTLRRETQRVPESVRLHDYNHRQAGVSLLVEENAARDDKTTNAVDYRWGEHYETPEEGRRVARLRHEAHLASQITYKGTGNPFWLEAGEVMRVEPKPADAKHGIFITSVESKGGRSDSYWVSFEGIPSDRVWRTPMASIRRPAIDGILPARITSPGDYKYAYLTEQGWYVIKLPFDLDEWSPGGTSRPVRFAKPYSGGNYGHHFPLIDGAEVAIVFTNGHPDRPIIIGAMHDSLNPDLVNNLNHTRNIVRTAAQNELRMEDKEGAEHIHLTTPHQTSELNLGHMVDESRKERGKGAELRTDEHVAVRGGKGVFISADMQFAANGRQLDMRPAQELLELGLQQMQSLAEAAKAAEAVAADYSKQKVLLDETLSELKKAGVLISGPAGVGMVSGDHLQLTASKNLIATAGANAEIGVVKQFTVAAGETVSMFAAKLGIKLFAAKGKVAVQAQTDEMALAALKDLTITSSEGRLVLSAAKEVWIGAGGSYIRIDANRIENGTPGDILEKCASWNKSGAASAQISTALPNSLPAERLMLSLAASPSAMAAIPQDVPYKLYAQGVLVARGVTDATGRIAVEHRPGTQSYRLEFANGVAYQIPVSEEFRGDATNGQLANQGFHFYEQGAGGDEEDRAVHRQHYYRLLNPDIDTQDTEAHS
ncbi:type VI secretion system Vgr family protein [Burkholderia stagnalis]|uniref:type VI secretion system Vgr family protein n=1 Tax=Burkholderia stagnalis TaxID=1503054 RepID=UPI00075A7599|nr:type VI secretion system Vgr family protein [Burkholderia stagnalis]KVO51990.1 type VI secretion protein Vgr [Burkholderia stagnalis]KVP10959.1 type VI secretion protein Vgr [Burkholderia stagnalis]KVW98671.1 type VI secretion protein Vgr [Burkholderia stagnalis]KWH83124.1 type VI secretion protein Vgr [Burkholderia stagnalis]KWK21887.1 type VI secretion protein Vgr [Burkholderia stagnalis]